MRTAISARDKLSVTLRFLATGETFVNLSYSTRISVSAISRFIPKVLEALYDGLKEKYLKVPSNTQEWLEISYEFFNKWNMPNTVGAIDGKHITFRAPRSAEEEGSEYKVTESETCHPNITLTGVTYNRTRANCTALEIREEFKSYFNTCGAVSWQNDMV
ncbi:hypothetical protein QE152_g34794 [Popillia japonica]|uniref:Nuclease HARBI1 n=1 Tax=Popillia japonica TaxID=7064 RepID=A0AAW1IT50_POPJA